MIKKFDDTKNDLRKLMTVEVMKDAYLIRVALGLSDGKQAALIVNAVVKSYLKYNNDYKRSGNLALRTSLEEHLKNLQNQIVVRRAELKALYAKGTVDPGNSGLVLNATKNDDDTTKPTFTNVTIEQGQIMIAEMMKTDLALLEAQATLKATLEAVDQANEEDKGLQEPKQSEEQKHRIEEEFRKDPEVIALSGELVEAEEHRDHVRSLVRQPNDPVRREAEVRYNKLWGKYEELWKERSAEIGTQLKNTVAGTPPAQEAISDLRLKVAALKAKKEDQARLYEELKVQKKQVNDDVFESALVKYQLDMLLKNEEQVKTNLSQLVFQTDQEQFRVQMVDFAAAPKSPTDNKRVRYMAAAPVVLLFMVLGLFFFLEVKAERIADPDTLSTRVRSEVYGLPVLPSPRSIRNSRTSEIADQIDQFIQRLDHVRFAVCGNSSGLGRGRCVLVTSAVEKEGKTTLASQLALRCGRRGSLPC